MHHSTHRTRAFILLCLFLVVIFLVSQFLRQTAVYAADITQTTLFGISDIVINEVDADTSGADTAEFIELFDGGVGNTALDGLVVVLFNGSTDTSYRAIDLDSYATNAMGYFVLGNAAVLSPNLTLPNGSIQNGADAVALYMGNAADFTNGTAVTTTNLLDVLVYDNDHLDDLELLTLLNPGQPQVNENGRNNKDFHANQRCPNGSGGQRNTIGYLQNFPTPGTVNNCVLDNPPIVTGTVPVNGASDVAVDATLNITFSEEVGVTGEWFMLTCGLQTWTVGATAVTSGPIAWQINPNTPLPNGHTCTVTIFAAQVTDQDGQPDNLASDYSWQFSTIAVPPATNILINEVDVDTPGIDAQEFIELYDGGTGNTNLTGLALVFYNGSSNAVYDSIDLDGYTTNGAGYFVLGNTAVTNTNLILPDGSLQNGPDAVALFVGNAADFTNGTAVTTTNLLDALVYDTDDPDDPELLTLLNPGQPQINENGRGKMEERSNQRCPNGAGGQLNTTGYLQNDPTPGIINNCVIDDPPIISGTNPLNNALDMPIDTAISITFNEAVTPSGEWFTLTCGLQTWQMADTAVAGGPTTWQITPNTPLPNGQTCTVTIFAAQVTDQDGQPDNLASDYSWQFSTIALPPATQMLINEVDADTQGVDIAEFIELYDGGSGNTALDGLVVVLYNGGTDTSYRAIDLDGFITDANGYFVLGGTAVANTDLVLPDSSLQNGPDAVALFVGNATDFTNGTAVTTTNLLDALVYDTDDLDDPELLTLLNPGQPQINENSRGAMETHSNQRCPNGAGSQRDNDGYLQNNPTPGIINNCVIDDPPFVSSTIPFNNALDLPIDSNLNITFNEDVAVTGEWFTLACGVQTWQVADTAVTGGPATWQITPNTPLPNGQTCTVTIFAAQVADLDGQPNNLASDYSWQFSIIALPPATHMLINEVDADTTGTDTAEFIELYDGGLGSTALDGLVVVLFNGSSDSSYRAIDLDGFITDANGYFVLGGTAVANVDLVIPDSSLQNGADAVALFVGNATDFANGTAVTTANLLDALVYGTDDADDPELLALLNANQPQVNENGRHNKEIHSNQRCPNGAGEQRNTAGYLQNNPTPGLINNCILDDPPTVSNTNPTDGKIDVPIASTLMVTFNEAVAVSGEWFVLSCGPQTWHIGDTAVTGGPTAWEITPNSLLPNGQNCTITIFAAQVADLDGLPDNLTADYSWQFSTLALPPATHMLINEVDADTPGSDKAEFIELYDGGSGNTSLSGLVVVLFNGSNNKSYKAFDLFSMETNDQGYFVLGNEAVSNVDLIIPNKTVQNGADAVALYIGSTSDFPNGTAVTTTNLLDALVYDTNDGDDDGLLPLLNPGQPQVNENGANNKNEHANQRCPDGSGGQRNTDGYKQNPPTPGEINDCTTDNPPVVSSTTPADGAGGVLPNLNLIVEFSEDVTAVAPWITLTCSESGTSATAVAGEGQNYVISPANLLQPGDFCTATILRSQITDQDGTPTAMVANYSWQFTVGVPAFGVCGEPATPIHTIQGNGLDSLLVGQQGIIIEGVVVGEFLTADGLQGFFVQEESSQWDDDPQTSEGIFVYDTNNNIMLTKGDLVRLQGDVVEYQGLTELTNIHQIASCNATINATPTVVNLPIADLAEWEQYEGMLITIPQTLAVTGHRDLGRSGQVDLASDSRLMAPTAIVSPGIAANELQSLNDRRRIILDDGRNQITPTPLPPYLGPDNTLRVGDTTDNLTGVLTFTADNYRLHPTKAVAFTRQNGRNNSPPPTNGRLQIASYDLHNYFNGDGQGDGFPTTHGAETLAEFTRQRTKLISALTAMQADIIGLTGLENDGYGEDSAIQDLVNGLNDAAPAGTSYAFVNPQLAQLGMDDVAVGLLYRVQTVTPLGTAVTTNTIPFDAGNRQPLAQAFGEVATGETFTVVVNHFKSKSSCPNAGENSDQGDGQGCWNAARTAAATTLTTWLSSRPTGSSDPDLLLLGNLNAYALEDPVTALQMAGYTNLSPLNDEATAYNAILRGQSGTLDYALANNALTTQVSGAVIWHNNADEPTALDYRAANQPALYQADPFRAAEHDPLIIGLNLSSVPRRLIFIPILFKGS